MLGLKAVVGGEGRRLDATLARPPYSIREQVWYGGR